jgi:hypothetical protein
MREQTNGLGNADDVAFRVISQYRLRQIEIDGASLSSTFLNDFGEAGYRSNLLYHV